MSPIQAKSKSPAKANAPEPSEAIALKPMVFKIDHCFTPYVRMTQAGKWVKPDAQRYLASQAAIKQELWEQMQAKGYEAFPRGISLSLTLIITHAHKFNDRDADNEIKSLSDAAQKIAYANDQWIDRIYADRRLGDTCQVIMVIKVRE